MKNSDIDSIVCDLSGKWYYSLTDYIDVEGQWLVVTAEEWQYYSVTNWADGRYCNEADWLLMILKLGRMESIIDDCYSVKKW